MPLTPSSNRRAFTLIELLVVIVIIGILMSLLLPGISRAIRSSKSNKAAAEAQNLVGAVVLFEREYGYLPIPIGSQGLGQADQLYDADESKQIMMVLMAEEQGSGDWDPLNYKKTSYLEMDMLSADGEMLDPWKNQYQFFMDRNMDKRIEYPEGSGNVYRKKALVVSPGPDGDIETQEDNVTSVQVED